MPDWRLPKIIFSFRSFFESNLKLQSYQFAAEPLNAFGLKFPSVAVQRLIYNALLHTPKRIKWNEHFFTSEILMKIKRDKLKCSRSWCVSIAMCSFGFFTFEDSLAVCPKVNKLNLIITFICYLFGVYITLNITLHIYSPRPNRTNTTK